KGESPVMSAQDGCKLPVRAKINVLSFRYFKVRRGQHSGVKSERIREPGWFSCQFLDQKHRTTTSPPIASGMDFRSKRSGSECSRGGRPCGRQRQENKCTMLGAETPPEKKKLEKSRCLFNLHTIGHGTALRARSRELGGLGPGRFLASGTVRRFCDRCSQSGLLSALVRTS